MPMWRCPHCGTPQAETARCWVCRRSSTTCSTCRHFRRSVAAQLGYCGLDKRRLPLAGDELRGCWEAGPVRAFDALPAAAGDERPADPAVNPPSSAALRLRDFVPVELAQHRAARARLMRSSPPEPGLGEPAPTSVPLPPIQTPNSTERTTLFTDAEL